MYSYLDFICQASVNILYEIVHMHMLKVPKGSKDSSFENCKNCHIVHVVIKVLFVGCL